MSAPTPFTLPGQIWSPKRYLKTGRKLAAYFLACVLGLVFVTQTRADLVFDNMSNFENGVAGANNDITPFTPNNFMGDGYALAPGTIDITGFDVFPVNLSGTDFTGLEITIYVWANVNTGTVNAGSPAFGNLLASYTLFPSGTFPSGFYFPFEGNPAGTTPGITLATPLTISDTNIGITLSYQGTTDGVNYTPMDDLTSLIAFGTPPTVGSQLFNGYFRNANSETDGNFTSSLRSLGQSFQSLGLRIYGTVPIVGNLPPVATPASVLVQKNTSKNITLAATDANHDPLTYSVVANPTNGILTGSAPNLVYTPNLDYAGPDAFSFKANDGQTDSLPATVTITVIPGSAGLIINPTWDATILADPNVAAITNTIETAIQILESKFSDTVTVSILFKEMNSGLGQSQTYIGSVPYSTYYSALVADSKTTNDVAALPHIPGGALDPANGGANITCALPLFRALGFSAGPPSGQPDSTVSLNMSLINPTRTAINPSKYDLQAVVSHEMDEVLGTSSGVGQANISPVDLFRYTAAGSRTFTTVGDDAYFSLDGGVTDLVRYNQDSRGDYGDFWSVSAHSPTRVQDAFGTPGATPDLGAEITILDVIGWDLVRPVSIPAPNFLSVAQASGTITFNWNSVAGQTYQVEYRTDLTTGTWTSFGSPIVASNVIISATDNVGPDSQRFYHVKLLPAPSQPKVVSKIVSQPKVGSIKLRQHVTNPAPAGGLQIIPGPSHAISPSIAVETVGVNGTAPAK